MSDAPALAVPERLGTPRLWLRAVQASDAEALHAINGDAEVTAFLPYPTWQSPADYPAWRARLSGAEAEGSARLWGLARREDDRLVGTAQLFRYEPSAARAELGYVLGRAGWGQGLMQEALSALLTAAFASGLARIEAEVDPHNRRSLATLQALGFSCEGLRRQRWRRHGQPLDVESWARLASDPPPPLEDPAARWLRPLLAGLPMARALQLRVLRLRADEVCLQAPYGPNRNPHGSVFGGSQAALALIAGWSLVQARLRAEGLVAIVVGREARLRYRRPLSSPAFEARARPAAEPATEDLGRALREHRSARLAVRVSLHEAGSVEEAAVLDTGFTLLPPG
ncbi:MAG TPA: YiiD C-terminal domain-containing protein [Nevskiaceae bacterium]|nr:YiiD C-terminal domain-containing protein [Nevskiaceae bacterium]